MIERLFSPQTLPLTAFIVGLIAVFIILSFLFRRGKLVVSRKTFEETADSKRKKALHEFAKRLYIWKTVHGHYPDGSTTEFQDFLKENELLFVDPQDAYPTGHRDGQYFGYAYDNLHIDSRGNYQKDIHNFRLICYLENLNDPDLNQMYREQDPGRYMLVSNEFETTYASEILASQQVKVQKAMAAAGSKDVDLEQIVAMEKAAQAEVKSKTTRSTLVRQLVYPYFSPVFVLVMALFCLGVIIFNIIIFVNALSLAKNLWGTLSSVLG